MTDLCRKRTVQGSRGMHAEDSAEYGCSLEKGHTQPCDYSRRLGKPTTSVGVADAPPIRWSVSSRLAALEALSERASAREREIPMRTYVRLMDQIKATRDVLVAFGPTDEVDRLMEKVMNEVTRWE